MKALTPSRPPALALIAGAILFILLAVLETMASHVNAVAGDPATPWVVHIRRVDAALTTRDVSAAERAWHDAYTAALGSRRWEGLVEVGDAARRIGESAEARWPAHGLARRAYLTALLRARQGRSVDGVLRVAEAFAVLGDREVVAQCIRIAQRLAAIHRDDQAQDRILAFSERLSQRSDSNH